MQADPVLLVFRLDFASLRNARRTLDQMDRLGIRRQQLRLVVNRYGQPKEIPFAKAEEALGAKIFHYVPDDPKSVNRANNNGVPVVLESPSAKIARSVMRLAEASKASKAGAASRNASHVRSRGNGQRDRAGKPRPMLEALSVQERRHKPASKPADTSSPESRNFGMDRANDEPDAVQPDLHQWLSADGPGAVPSPQETASRATDHRDGPLGHRRDERGRAAAWRSGGWRRR